MKKSISSRIVRSGSSATGARPGRASRPCRESSPCAPLEDLHQRAQGGQGLPTSWAIPAASSPNAAIFSCWIARALRSAQRPRSVPRRGKLQVLRGSGQLGV